MGLEQGQRWDWRSHSGYQDQILPTGHTAGTPEEALDCAASLYLDNP